MVQGGQWGVVVAAVQTCSAVTCARGRTPGRCACLLRAWLAMAWPLPRSVQGGGAGGQSWEEEAALQMQASEQLRRQI